MEFSDPLTQLTELAGNVADAYTIALFALNGEKKELFLRSSVSLAGDEGLHQNIPLGLGAVGSAATSREPRLVENCAATREESGVYLKPHEIRAYYALPAVHDGLQGVLYIDSKNQFAFSIKQQKILQGFAAQMAWHLRMESQPRLARSSEESLPLQEVIQFGNKLAAGEEISAVAGHLVNLPPGIVNSEASALVWFEAGPEDEGKVVAHRGWGGKYPLNQLRIPIGKSIVGSCAKNRLPFHIGDTDQRKAVLFAEDEGDLREFRSRIAVPVQSNNRLYAVLVCASRRRDALTANDMRRLQLVAAQAAQCIENLQIRRKWELERNIDPITRLPNHRFLAENRSVLEAEVFCQERPRFLLLLHIRNLASVYETQGLECGDKVQKHIASLLERAAPAPKHIFKFSDSSFLLFMLGGKRDEAEHFENRLRHVFEDNSISIDGKDVPVIVKLGSACYPEDGRTLSDLLGASLSRSTQPLKISP